MRFAPLAVLPDLSESGVDLSRYVFVCLLTIGLVLACAWLLRRFVAQGLQRRAAQRSLAVMDVLPLGRKQRAVVLRCYDRSFLVGIGERELTLLAELDPAAHEEPEPSPAARPIATPAPRPRTEARAIPSQPEPVASIDPAPAPAPAPTPAPVSTSRPTPTPAPEPDNFAEALAAELPVPAAKIQPGMRIPKEGFLG